MYKRLKKLVICLLVNIMIFNHIFPHNVLMNVNNDFQIILDCDYEKSLTGVIFTQEEFNNAFGRKESERITPLNFNEIELKISDIIISDNEVEMELNLTQSHFLGNVMSLYYSASIEKIGGRYNLITFQITEVFDNGFERIIYETFSIENNSSATFIIERYQFFVETYGNNKIRNLQLINNGIVSLLLKGNIYNGNREESTYVIVFDENEYNFEVLLFEINLNPSKANLVLQNSKGKGLDYLPHAKIYLLCPLGNIIMFEIELPEEFHVLNYNEFYVLDNTDDIFWPFRFIDFYSSYEDNFIMNTYRLYLDKIINYYAIEINYDSISDIFNAIEFIFEDDFTSSSFISLVEQSTGNDKFNSYYEISHLNYVTIMPLARTQSNEWYFSVGAWRGVHGVFGNEWWDLYVRAVYIRQIEDVSGNAGAWRMEMQMQQYGYAFNLNTGALNQIFRRIRFFEFRDMTLGMGVSAGGFISEVWVWASMIRGANAVQNVINLFTSQVGARLFRATTGFSWNTIQNATNLFRDTNVSQGTNNRIYTQTNPRTIQFATRNRNYRMDRNGTSTFINSNDRDSNGHTFGLGASPRRNTLNGAIGLRDGQMRWTTNIYLAAREERHPASIYWIFNFRYMRNN